MENNRVFLLIDDDMDDSELFCEALAESDGNVVCNVAENGNVGLEFLRENPEGKPSFIFLDVNMPIMDGWQCLTALKSQPDSKDVPVVMYSTSSTPIDVDRASRLGAFCFLSKPDNYFRLCEVLAVFVKASRSSLCQELSGFREIRYISDAEIAK